MDGFNPLDLLASAAELQQKHEDGPERIIITRQRRSSAVKHTPLTNGQKENRDFVSNNNNNVVRSKPSVVIVKKIKKVELNPELEKMFDEHNYGSAKRNSNNKIDKGNDSYVEINGRKRKRTDSDSDNYTSDQCVQSSVTVGHSRDKVTTVVANAQPGDSEFIHVGKCKVEFLDKDSCSNRISVCKHDSREEKCLNSDVGTKDCTKLEKQNLQNGNTNKPECMSGKFDSQVNDKPQDVNRTNGTMIVKYNNSKFDRGSDTSTDSAGLSSYSDLKLDEYTGELITGNGEKVINKQIVTEKGDNFDNGSDDSTKSVCTHNGEKVDNEKSTGTEFVKCVKSETIVSPSETVSTSELKNMPYMKVVPSEVVSEPSVEKPPQTLVINITRGRNNSNSFSNTASLSNRQSVAETGKMVASKVESNSSDIGIIKSLLVKSKLDDSLYMDETWNKKKPVILNIVKPRPKLETMTSCSSKDLSSQSSCDSLKELELSDSVCVDDSPNSVHLLSPDCRNPDSVGVVESPLTSRSNDTPIPEEDGLTKSEENDDDNDVIENDESLLENETNDANMVIISSPVHSKHSESAIDSVPSCEDAVSDSGELTEDSRLLLTERAENCDNSASDMLPASTSGNDIPIFRFESDHCYAGLPGKITAERLSAENETSIASEGEEPQTPLGSQSELSQDSGYEDVTQSPEVETPSRTVEESAEKQVMLKTLVPVLVSVNSNGSLTVHDTNLSKTLGGQMFLPDNVKLLAGTNLAAVSQTPLILSPVTLGKNSSPLLTEAPKLIPAKPESIIGLLSPKGAVSTTVSADSQEISPPKFGTYRIGTFASFSNTGMGIDSPTKQVSPAVTPTKMASPASVKSQGSGIKSGKTSPVDTLGSLVQKVKSSLSPVSHTEPMSDHIQHDHDYCTKNLMPSVVNSFLEARLLSRETPKGKVMHARSKRADSESAKSEGKSGKRKRAASCLVKEDSYDEFDVDSESDTHSIPEPLRPKHRSDKYAEHKRADPKVKITGSSDFQDQFVYFMNTKKRSRRRESKDIPLPSGTDRTFIPPKPGDIIVPHLTDQDIENLKIRSKSMKQAPASAGYNSLRNEFMAAKLSNGTFSATQSNETVVDDKNIINTILSLENENLGSPVPAESSPYNESMELYGQGLGADIMSLLPEQMNLTQEQMDLLYSAVDEVQNSSPGLVGAEKLVSTETSGAFQFPMSSFDDSSMASAKTDSLVVKDTAKEDGKEEKVERDEPIKTEEALVLEAAEPAVTSDDSVTLQDTEVASTSDGSVNVQTDSANVEAGSAEDEKTDSVVLESDAAEVPESLTDKVVSDVNLGISDEKPVMAFSDMPPVVNLSLADTTVTTGTKSDTAAVSVMSNMETLSVTDSLESTGSGITGVNSNTQFVQGSDVCTDKSLFPAVNSGNASFNSEISTSSTPSLTSEILPQIDKSLDLLGSDFGLGKNYLFPDTTVSDSVVTGSSLSSVQPVIGSFTPTESVSSMPVTSQVNFSSPSVPSQVDYNAPWIVTVSMYWNDLPAIMVNNQPFVRLVDIHKQILPAKDTGILKKRCQLMRIEVENCTEMQRYFLVQYGKAFNSKSTLIISKDNAKTLIGYYVDPQPKMSRSEDHHKSIIDHRREQLRRIALARRAAMRAQRSCEKKDEIDHRDINEPARDSFDSSPVSSLPEMTKTVEVPKVTAVQHPAVVQPGDRAQRSTRHKKINFLEMLRGDATSHNAEDETSEEQAKKTSQKIHQVTLDKKKRRVKEQKVKVVKYTVETESSEETESMESDYAPDDYGTESSSDSEVQPEKRPPKQRKISSSLVAKAKSRMNGKVGPRLYNKGLKVKFGLKKSRPSATSTPVAIQVLNKSTGTKLGSRIYRTKVTPQKSKKLLTPQNFSPPVLLSKNVYSSEMKQILPAQQSESKPQKLTFAESGTDTTDAGTQQNIDPKVTQVSAEPSVEFPSSDMFDSSQLKVPVTLPEDILETPTDTAVKTDGEIEKKLTESVDVQTESGFDENDEAGSKSVDEANVTAEEKTAESPQINNTEMIATVSRANSPNAAQGIATIMERKEIEQVGYEEIPLRVVHRDSSPQTQPRTRSQLGEVFVERYHNKKSLCVRCYTCRKMMSVDNFLRHLHDVSGGLMNVNVPRTIDLSEGETTPSEKKQWGSFLRKKELFDNNQIPSPDLPQSAGLIYKMDEDVPLDNSNKGQNLSFQRKQSGPRIITTPVSPVKKANINKNRASDKKTRIIGNVPLLKTVRTVKRPSPPVYQSQDGLRTSSRKRKVKHMDGFEDYSFKKYPRLMKNAVVQDEES